MAKISVRYDQGTTAHINRGDDGEIIVIQTTEYRCPFCKKLLMQSVAAKTVLKTDRWDIKIRCSRCKSMNFYKLK